MRRLPMVAVTIAFCVLSASAPAAQHVRPPCGGCVVILMEPPPATTILPVLNGLRVAVAMSGVADRRAIALVAQVRQAGGIAALLVRGAPDATLPSEVTSSIDELIVDVSSVPLPVADLTFQLKTRFTDLRAASPRLRLGFRAPAPLVRTLLSNDLSAYVDFVVTDDCPPSICAGLAWWRDVGSVRDAATALQRTRHTDAERTLVEIDGSAIVRTRTLAELATVVPSLPPGLVEAPDVTVRCAGRRAEVWFDASRLTHVAWLSGCSSEGDVDVPSSHTVTARAILASGDMLIALATSSADRFAAGVDVRAPRPLTVEEVVARHQAAAARQHIAVRTLISSGTMTLTFEAPGFVAPVTISSVAIILADGERTEIEQRSIRVNGIAFTGGGVPRLPILEPERVASPPLAITLTDVYRYRLRGTEVLNGATCYVVSFVPAMRDRSLFEGRAWIDGETFGIVRIAAVQTGLRGPITSSEQVDDFRREAGDLWLLARSHVRQLYEGAAHRTPIDRVLAIDRHEINPPDFADRRRALYASDSIVLRDTPNGYRYLRRTASADSTTVETSPDATRELAPRADRVKTLAFGVIVDPNINRPLPFAGLSYVDFDFLGTGAQFSGFFGGTYGQFAFSIPSVRGTRWQLAGRAFAIASSFNDRSFSEGREQYEQNIRQRPAHASAWLMRPVSPRVSIRAGYEFDYTHFAANDTTAPGFVVPVSQQIHGFRLAAEGQRDGWRATAWWNPALRGTWRPWGSPARSEYEAGQRDFQRFGASLMRSEVLSPTVLVRAEASWMASRDLDRFSRYNFGAFENRLRGYPAAMIRYDRGAVLRGAGSWSPGPRVRFDAFLDAAFVHDPAFGRGLTRLTGVGTAVEAPAPFGMLIAGEWGYGLQGRRADGGTGTHVFRITGYKIF